MSPAPIPTQTLLVSFSSQDDEHSDLAALTMVRRISQNCSLFLIEDQDQSPTGRESSSLSVLRQRTRRLKSIAQELGLKLDIAVHGIRQGLAELKDRSVDELIVLHQPKFALDRQTLTFRQIERTLLSLPNKVLFAPVGASFKGRRVIAFGHQHHFSEARLATQLAGPEGHLEAFDFETLSDIAEPQGRLRLTIQSQSPAIIWIAEAVGTETKTIYSRLAAVLSVPVLVTTHSDT